MRKSIANHLAVFPKVIEYHYTKEEEEDIDKFQLKKCIYFKKLILEISHDGGCPFGIPVPVGYDSIQEIEGWPLLQSFAMDDVFTPTGFFMARYNVIDITTQLEVLRFSPLLPFFVLILFISDHLRLSSVQWIVFMLKMLLH